MTKLPKQVKFINIAQNKDFEHYIFEYRLHYFAIYAVSIL